MVQNKERGTGKRLGGDWFSAPLTTLEGEQREGPAVALRATPEMEVSEQRDTRGSGIGILLTLGMWPNPQWRHLLRPSSNTQALRRESGKFSLIRRRYSTGETSRVL